MACPVPGLPVTVWEVWWHSIAPEAWCPFWFCPLLLALYFAPVSRYNAPYYVIEEYWDFFRLKKTKQTLCCLPATTSQITGGLNNNTEPEKSDWETISQSPGSAASCNFRESDLSYEGRYWYTVAYTEWHNLIGRCGQLTHFSFAPIGYRKMYIENEVFLGVF